jgi:3-phenylpropionate/trans-cinnamate dioxygenase ferredoxin reductase component
MTQGGMVIVGAGMAGARAVINLRANGWQGPITLVGEESLLPYDRPPLSKAMIVDDNEPSPVLLLDEGMLASLNATFIRAQRVTGLDRAAHAITLADGRSIAYEKLLIATGAKPRRLTIPGGELALTLRDYPDADELRQRLRANTAVAIIGGGFIGLELAASARKLGCEVSLIEAQPRILMRGVPEAIAEVVHQRHVAAGVNMHVGTGLQSIEANGVRLQDGRMISAGTIIAGIGAAPETTLAAQAGLVLDNGIACDETLRTSDSDIFAAGDCCSFPHPLFGHKRIRLEAWRNAQDQAAVAAENMLGGTKPYTAVPWFWSDQYELSLQIAGMPADGTEVVRRTLSPEAFLLCHRDINGRLVGVSGIGPGNSIARDVKLIEMMIAKGISPEASALADPAISLKSLLKG